MKLNQWIVGLALLIAAGGAAAQQQVQAKGYPINTSVTITRPANTTAYTGGDVVGQADTAVAANAGTAILSFQNACIPGGTTWITRAWLRIDVASVPSGMTSFRLHLYDTSPTAILDNAAWDLVSGDRAYYLGYIDLGTPVDVGSTLYVQSAGIGDEFKCASGSTTLYGELVTNGGYTPSSGAVKGVGFRGLGL